MRVGLPVLPLLVAGGSLLLGAQSKGTPKLRYPEGIHWQPDVKQALREAARRNAPLLVVFMQDGEKLCELMHRREHRDKRIIRLSRRFVCLLASRGTHGLAPGRGVDGRRRRLCRKFGCVTCAEHQRVELWAFRKFNQNGVVEVPWHVLCTPDGKVIARYRHDVTRSAEDLAGVMRRALELVGPGLDAATYRRLTAALRRAEEEIAAGRIQRAVKRLQAVVQAGGRSAVAGEAKARLASLEEEAGARLREIDRLMAAGSYREAKARARELAERYRGLEAARLFRDRLRLLAGSGGGAARLWERAEALYRRGDYLRAAGLYRRLVAKHPATPQAARARERLRRLEADPQLKEALARQRMEEACRRWLRLAAALHRAGRREAAGEVLRRIIAKYPRSPFARQAREWLRRWRPDGV